MKKKILVSTSTFASPDETPLKIMQDAGFKVLLNPYKRKLTKGELLELLPGCIGMIAGLETLDREVFGKSQLRVISRCGAGIDNIDLQAAQDMGIIIRNTPDAPTNAVAELTLACMLNLLRMVSQMDHDLHQGQWKKRIGLQLEGKTVLIVGFGRIGRRLSELLEPFHVQIIVSDPLIDSADVAFQTTGLMEALPLADIITLHCNAKQCLLSAKEFALVKRGAILLNASRGHLIDEKALIQALSDGCLAGVWIDTFDQEPYAGALSKFPQALLTPHVGSYTLETRRLMEMSAANNLISALNEFRK